VHEATVATTLPFGVTPIANSPNLETVLRHAGLTLANVVRWNYYTRDVGAFLEAASSVGPRFQAAGCQPASTLLGVASLFHPDILVEIEATAVQ
jgi:enamine deaminase RidA (YjgF/YER057c/UK114 family)